jgi:amino acid transporter
MSTSKHTEKGPPSSFTSSESTPDATDDATIGTVSSITAGSQALHRKLRGKEVQLFAIGGAIGTCESTVDFKKQI